ncbi:MAG TPA: hypothetical protein VHR45_18615 [Thermoanaerobaculia bacterium]|nr:hypothetical protein [Thermoanaerobaculia bacterium]
MGSLRTKHHNQDDFFGSLARAINTLREAGFEDAAGELRQAAFETAWRTPTEMLGRVGQTIQRVERLLAGKMPPQAVTDLKICIRRSQQVWPTMHLR